LEIKTEAQRKAYVHPVRMQILGLLTQRSATVSQVASELGVHPANITHHFKILEAAGLADLTEVRDCGKYVEKYYRATAQTFVINPPAGSVDHANAKVLAFLRNDLTGAVNHADDREAVIGLIQIAPIDAARFQDFAKRLEALVADFSKVKAEDGDRYTLNVSLYPSKVDYGPLKRIEIRKKPPGKTKHQPTVKRTAK
jgi:DNA-binding transcriptional ArsR family regulator